MLQRASLEWARWDSLLRNFPMTTTSVGWLERLRGPNRDSADGRRLQDIYVQIIRSWLRRVPGLGDEVDDLTQEVVLIVLRQLPSFEHRGDGSFRAWLKGITLNCIRTFQKSLARRPRCGGEALAQAIAQISDPASKLSRQWDKDHDRYMFQKLVAIVKPDFAETTWEAFWRVVMKDEPPNEVAAALGISVGAVAQCKCRVVKRLREETGKRHVFLAFERISQNARSDSDIFIVRSDHQSGACHGPGRDPSV